MVPNKVCGLISFVLPASTILCCNQSRHSFGVIRLDKSERYASAGTTTRSKKGISLNRRRTFLCSIAGSPFIRGALRSIPRIVSRRARSNSLDESFRYTREWISRKIKQAPDRAKSSRRISIRHPPVPLQRILRAARPRKARTYRRSSASVRSKRNARRPCHSHRCPSAHSGRYPAS